jgi:RNA polymerase sigma-70 factor (ECF subfamily)
VEHGDQHGWRAKSGDEVPPVLERDELARQWAGPAMRRRLAAFARRFVGPRGDAEDVAQEALARASDRLATLRSPERAEAWLLRICRHAAIDHVRWRAVRRHVWAPMPEEAESWAVPEAPRSEPEPPPGAVIDLRVLPAHHRLLMSLHYEKGLAQGRICRLTGLSASALRVRLFRARAVLARRCRSAPT